MENVMNNLKIDKAHKILSCNTNVAFYPKIPFYDGWNKIQGLTVRDGNLIINMGEYFERLEDPTWTYVPWGKVQKAWDILVESPEIALEQACLTYISQNSEITTDPNVVLSNAENVYSYLFNEDRIKEHEDLQSVTPKALRVLRESSILCALNKVDTTGHICNIGPAWYFAQCSELVYSLTSAEASEVDELFHGGFFNGPRLRDQVRAHVALAGKLVHGCQGSGYGSGGCVANYGTNIDQMQCELLELRPHFLSLLSSLDKK